MCLYGVVSVKCIGGAVEICCCILYEVFECGLCCGLSVVGTVRSVVPVLPFVLHVLGDMCVFCQRFD